MRGMNEAIRVRRPGVLGTAAALLTFLAAAPSGAAPAAVEVSSAPPAEMPAAALRIEGGQVLLSVDEAVALALERNLGLRVQRYGRQRTRLGIEQELGIYDLDLSGGASASHDESPSASNLEGAEVQKQDREGFTIGLGQLLPSGGTAGASWSNGRLETNSQFFLLNPSYSSGFDLSFNQPLLRNFGRGATEFGIEVARLQSDVARDAFLEQVITTVQRAENAYWNLVGARFRLRVAEESLALARQLHENNRIRVDVGTLAPLELASSEAGIATRQEEIIRTRGAIGDAEDILRYLLNLDDEKTWSLPIVPETEVGTEPLTVALPEALATALESRPELSRERVAQQSREVEAAFYRQLARPRLDLRATYGYNGVGGDAILRDGQGNVIGTSPGGWDDALDQITGFDFPGWSLGLEFGYPLQNRTAKARSTVADLAVEQGRVGVEEIRQGVQAEVRIAVRGLDTARQQMESARVSVTLGEKNLDAERKKYDNGLSTSFEILRVQDDLTAARSRLVDAETGYRKAIVEYHRSVGKLLDSAGVSIAD
jgi:outer membrane protein TolC